MTRFFKAFFAAALALLLAFSAALPASAVGVGPDGFNINATISGRITNTNALGSSNEVLNSLFGLYFTGGTGPGQIDTFYATKVTITASSTTTVDLNGGSTDAFGNSVAFLHVKALLLVADSGNTNDCQIGPGASNPFAGPWTGTTPLTAVSPGETLLITKGQGSALGWGVTASTGDVIKLGNSSSGSSVVCTLYAWGTST